MTGLFAWISLTACLVYVYGLMTGLFACISLTACLVYVYGLMTGLFAWISLTACIGLILFMYDIIFNMTFNINRSIL